MKKVTPVYPSLSKHDSEVLNAILYGESGGSFEHRGSKRPITEKLVKKYFNYFKGDADEIRSLCYGAALDAVARYRDKPAKEIYKLAVRMMVNRILNASKALSRKKRGGGARHEQIESNGDRGAFGWHGVVTQAEGGMWDIRTRDRLEIEVLRNGIDQTDPLSRVLAIEEAEQHCGSVEAAMRKLLS